MRLDTANRSFYRLVGLATAPFLLLGALGCGVLSVTAYRVITHRTSVLEHGPIGLVAATFVAASVVGAALTARSLLTQHRATTRLTAHLHRHQLPTTPRLRDLAQRTGIDRIQLIDDDQPYSLTYGITTPRTAISTGLAARTSDRELASALAHERYHTANRDPLKIALARAITAGFVFLPATRHLLHRYLTARELNADHHAQRHHGRSALAAALLRASGGPPSPLGGAAAGFGGDDTLDLRITQLETQTEPAMPPIPTSAITLTAVGLGAILAGLVATAIAVETPTILDPANTTTDLVGALACATTWLAGAYAIIRRSTPPVR